MCVTTESFILMKVYSIVPLSGELRPYKTLKLGAEMHIFTPLLDY